MLDGQQAREGTLFPGRDNALRKIGREWRIGDRDIERPRFEACDEAFHVVPMHHGIAGRVEGGNVLAERRE